MILLLSGLCQTSLFDHFLRKGSVIFVTELLSYVFADFKAVNADGRSDGGNHLCRVRAIDLMHHPHCLRSDAFDSPSPAGVHVGDGFVDRINDQKSHTVCIERHQCLAGDIRHHAVRVMVLIGPDKPISAVNILHDADVVRVGLV